MIISDNFNSFILHNTDATICSSKIDSDYFRPGHPLAKQPRPKLIAIALQQIDRDMTGDDYIGDPVAVPRPPNYRLISVLGQVGHIVNNALHIVDGSFEAVDSPGESVDAVCSQDAFLHSGERLRVVSEAARVLKPGGVFAFTDIMQADDCPAGVLQPILDRIHLSDLGSPAFYRSAASVQGLEEVTFRDLSPHLSTHYGRVLTETELWEAALKHRVSSDYLERMKKGLSHWVDGGERGYLVWGIFVFRKPSPA